MTVPYTNDFKLFPLLEKSGPMTRKLAYVIGLHGVQFGNNWMKKNS